ncbi:MAG: hypothetical protein ACLUJI_01380 [Faecalibacillus faecis]|uniref:hypothetical protein n=1 Tax=Faecalibacillus faecis TaxID=1982628 RepID=UPI0039953C54
MINAMKYKKEISNVGYNFRILEKNNKIVGCGSCADEMKCQECKFGYDEQGRTCDITRTEWLCQEYKEPIKLSRLEFELLKYFSKKYDYIFKEEIVYFENKSNKELVNLEDWGEGLSVWLNKGEFPIQDILNNCEVIEDVD